MLSSPINPSNENDGKRTKKELRKKCEGEFPVIIDHCKGDGLGIDVCPEADGTLKIQKMGPDVIDRWSHQLPDDSVEHAQVNMHIVEVNGRRSSTFELITACRLADVLHITFRPIPPEDKSPGKSDEQLAVVSEANIEEMASKENSQAPPTTINLSLVFFTVVVTVLSILVILSFWLGRALMD